VHYLPALKAWQGVSAGTDPVSRNGENLGCVALAERRSQVIVNAGGCSDPLQNIREAAVLAYRASTAASPLCFFGRVVITSCVPDLIFPLSFWLTV